MSEISFSTGSVDDVLEHLDPSAESLRDQLSIGDATHHDDVVLARLDETVVGYLVSTSGALGGNVVWEHVVAPKYRGRGIGRRLLLELARRMLPTASLTIDPPGDFAIEQVSAYYAALGFPGVSSDGLQVAAAAHKVVDAIGEQSEEDATLDAIVRRRSTGVVTIAAGAPVSEAVALLSEKGIGSVVVSGDGATIDGVLSERDIVVGLHRDGASILEGPVSDLMTTEVVTAETSDVVGDVMELMTTRRLRHMPVTDSGVLIGIVSVGDLLMFRMQEHDMRRDRLPYRDI